MRDRSNRDRAFCPRLLCGREPASVVRRNETPICDRYPTLYRHSARRLGLIAGIYQHSLTASLHLSLIPDVIKSNILLPMLKP